MPTYRVIDQHGVAIDPTFQPDLSDNEVIKLYRDMLTVSIMDIIMFDAQRQGRISFYMVSSGEEAACVGSASALTPGDVVFCQYREQGVFQQRGFTMKEFMGQLFANKNDAGMGRNMPVHYGSTRLNIVSFRQPFLLCASVALTSFAALYFISPWNAATPCLWRCICSEDTAYAKSNG